jgi:hypothetical protein
MRVEITDVNEIREGFWEVSVNNAPWKHLFFNFSGTFWHVFEDRMPNVVSYQTVAMFPMEDARSFLQEIYDIAAKEAGFEMPKHETQETVVTGLLHEND